MVSGRHQAEHTGAHPGVSRTTGAVGTVTALCSAIALSLGAATPPRSGPTCVGSCVGYPYTDVAAWVPRDYLWMYPALLTALCVVAMTACLHRDPGAGRPPWALVGFGFATVAAAALGSNYVIQLAVVQPSLLAGESRDLGLFTMYNPHGVFIALEDLGYLMMGAALLCCGLSMVVRSRLGCAARWTLVVAGTAVLVAALVLALVFGMDVADRFEVVAIGVDWTALVISGTLIGLLSRRKHPRTERPHLVVDTRPTNVDVTGAVAIARPNLKP